MKAHRQFADFAGRDEPELMAWLRRILVRTLADHARYHRSRGRNVRRQVSLEALLEQAGGAAQQALADSVPSPSSLAVRRECAVLLADALEKLPADYREVFVLRNIDHIPFNEIATRTGPLPGCGPRALDPRDAALERVTGGEMNYERRRLPTAQR